MQLCNYGMLESHYSVMLKMKTHKEVCFMGRGRERMRTSIPDIICKLSALPAMVMSLEKYNHHQIQQYYCMDQKSDMKIIHGIPMTRGETYGFM